MRIAILSRRLNQCNMRSRTFPAAVLCIVYRPVLLQSTAGSRSDSFLCFVSPWNDI